MSVFTLEKHERAAIEQDERANIGPVPQSHADLLGEVMRRLDTPDASFVSCVRGVRVHMIRASDGDPYQGFHLEFYLVERASVPLPRPRSADCNGGRSEAASVRAKIVVPVLILFSIFVPERMRRHGICSAVLARLEERCRSEARALVVMPVMEDTLHELLDRRYYGRAIPFARIWLPEDLVTRWSLSQAVDDGAVGSASSGSLP